MEEMMDNVLEEVEQILGMPLDEALGGSAAELPIGNIHLAGVPIGNMFLASSALILADSLYRLLPLKRKWRRVANHMLRRIPRLNRHWLRYADRHRAIPKSVWSATFAYFLTKRRPMPEESTRLAALLLAYDAMRDLVPIKSWIAQATKRTRRRWRATLYLGAVHKGCIKVACRVSKLKDKAKH